MKLRSGAAFLLVLLASPASSVPRPRAPLDAARLDLALARLEVVGTALYVAAHPDDENTAFLAWLAQGRGVRAAYLSLTRGDGGQNLIGSEQGPLIGLLRTQELLAAREIDLAEQWFTRAADFGYSRSAEETLRIWDREAVLGDIVWAIRKLRPDLVVTRFPKVNPETHGHHTASAVLAEEAFHAAGDPSRFPEQLGEVQPFAPRRLLFNNWRPKLEGRGAEDPPLVTVDLGGYSPRLGRAWSEIAAESRSQHKSQGFGSAERRGPVPNYFEWLAGEPLPGDGQDPFAGIDLGWTRIDGGVAVAAALGRARQAFRPESPWTVVAPLLEARAALLALPSAPLLAHERHEIDETIRSALGMWLEAVAERPDANPGGTLAVSTLALNRSPLEVSLESIELTHGEAAAAPLPPRPLAFNTPLLDKWTLRLPAAFPLTHPCWLDLDAGPDPAAAARPALRGRPEAPAPLVARFTLELSGPPRTRLVYEVPVAHRWTDPVEGERWRPIEVLPALAVQFVQRVHVFERERGEPVVVRVAATAAAAEGDVSLRLPAGWRATPASLPFRLGGPGEEARLEFTVTPPAASATGWVEAAARSGGQVHDRGILRIEHPHVPIQTLTPRARARLVRVDLPESKGRIGYLMGSGDELPGALAAAGWEPRLLDDAALDAAALEGLQAVVIGVRAFNTRPRLKTQVKTLLDWVERGGTLVVQYATSRELVTPQLGPFPLELSRDRVTVEQAPVRFALPGHPLLTRPHRIGAADFEGWVQERGLYFAGKWDPRYETPLGMADPGESEKLGALLYARHGRGSFVYTGLAFFRQLPAGVPGAYRLFANLIAPRPTEAP